MAARPTAAARDARPATVPCAPARVLARPGTPRSRIALAEYRSRLSAPERQLLQRGVMQPAR